MKTLNPKIGVEYVPIGESKVYGTNKNGGQLSSSTSLEDTVDESSSKQQSDNFEFCVNGDREEDINEESIMGNDRIGEIGLNGENWEKEEVEEENLEKEKFGEMMMQTAQLKNIKNLQQNRPEDIFDGDKMAKEIKSVKNSKDCYENNEKFQTNEESPGISVEKSELDIDYKEESIQKMAEEEAFLKMAWEIVNMDEMFLNMAEVDDVIGKWAQPCLSHGTWLPVNNSVSYQGDASYFIY